MEIVYLVIGVVAGIGIGYLLLRNQTSARFAEMFSQKSVAEQRSNDLLQQKQRIESDSAMKDQEILRLTGELSSAIRDAENLQSKLDEQKAELEKMQEKMKTEFRNLANDLLEEKSRKFTEQNKEKLGELLNPLSEKLKEFEKRVEDSHKESLQKNASLKQQLEDLVKLNQTIGEEARNLTLALKGQSKVQGNWGERVLENILEVSGLEKNREYFVQENIQSEDGRRFIPDVIIRLPEGKNIVVDSKVSISAYEAYCSAEDAVAQAKALNDHVNSVKNHVKGLSLKSYQQLYNLQTLDFVLLFIPIDAAYALVAQEEPALWTQAYEKNVIIVTPLSLLPSLRTIANLWKQEKQNRHAIDIAKQGGDLYDKFVLLMEDLQSLRSRFRQTQTAFDDALKKLQGRDNLIRKVERIKELGANASKQLPKELLDWATDENTET